MAPIPRDYLSDTPLLHAMGFLVSQHGQLGAIPPSTFSERFPVESIRSGGAIPPSPLKRGISAISARYPMKTRQMGAIPPSAILSREGIARYGGVSRTGPLSTAEEMQPNGHLEAQCAQHAPVEVQCAPTGSIATPKPRLATWETSHFSGLTNIPLKCYTKLPSEWALP